jgi:hypothetical protein
MIDVLVRLDVSEGILFLVDGREFGVYIMRW